MYHSLVVPLLYPNGVDDVCSGGSRGVPGVPWNPPRSLWTEMGVPWNPPFSPCKLEIAYSRSYLI